VELRRSGKRAAAGQAAGGHGAVVYWQAAGRHAADRGAVADREAAAAQGASGGVAHGGDEAALQLRHALNRRGARREQG